MNLRTQFRPGELNRPSKIGLDYPTSNGIVQDKFDYGQDILIPVSGIISSISITPEASLYSQLATKLEQFSWHGTVLFCLEKCETANRSNLVFAQGFISRNSSHNFVGELNTSLEGNLESVVFVLESLLLAYPTFYLNLQLFYRFHPSKLPINFMIISQSKMLLGIFVESIIITILL